MPQGPTDYFASLIQAEGSGASISQVEVEAAIANSKANFKEPLQAMPTNRSGTIATGGTSQSIAAANAVRQYFFLQNLSTGDLWVNFFGAAAAAQPSVRLSSGGVLEMVGVVLTSEIRIFGATTGQAFTALEA